MFLKRLSPFGGLALIVVIPVLIFSGLEPLRAWEGRLTIASARALSEFSAAGDALQDSSFTEAADKFATARQRFSEATAELETLRGFFRTVVDGTPFTRGKFQAGQRLLKAGEQLSAAGQDLTTTLAQMLQTPPVAEATAFPLAASFLKNSEGLAQNLASIQSSLRELQRVNPKYIPGQYRKRFAALKRGLPALQDRLATGQDAVPFLRDFFGANGQREYLFLFQNDAELRPGGGFIGSLALLHFDQGAFSILDAPGRGPFAVNDFFPKVLLPPQPVLAIAPYWTLHDANWFVDFPASAQKVLWFYEQARGFPVDGVVALTPRVIERLLAVTGPVSLPRYGLVLTQDNFLTLTEDQVEVQYDRAANQPKQFIVDLIPVILEKISSLPTGKSLAALAVLDESTRSKDLLLWLKNNEQRDRLSRLAWLGEIPKVTGDVVSVVDANLGGGKTSRSLVRETNLDIRVQGTTVENTLRLTYQHRGTAGDRLTGTPYRGYVKVYLPAGSTLIDSGGFDRPAVKDFFTPPADAQPDADLAATETNALLDEQSGMRKTDEFGLTAFGNWLVLNPGESQTVTLRYRSTAALDRQASGTLYRLTVIKQPGAYAQPLRVSVTSDRGLRLASVPVNRQAVTVSFGDTIDQDQRYLFLLKR